MPTVFPLMPWLLEPVQIESQKPTDFAVDVSVTQGLFFSLSVKAYSISTPLSNIQGLVFTYLILSLHQEILEAV